MRLTSKLLYFGVFALLLLGAGLFRPKLAQAKCYCAGWYCYVECNWCAEGYDRSRIKVSGYGKGSCLDSSVCTVTNVGGMAGCFPLGSWSYDVGCSFCTGGYFDSALGFSVVTDTCMNCCGGFCSPLPPPPCTCGGWVNRACGGGSCPATQRQQTRDCNPDGCETESRCVADAACVCSVAPPTNPGVSSTCSSAVLTWNEGSGGTRANVFRLGEDQARVENGCPGAIGPGTGCLVREDLGRGVGSFDTQARGITLEPETTYYWRVAEVDEGTSDWIDFRNACKLPGSETFTTPSCPPVIPPSCSVNGPTSAILGESPYYSVTPSDPDGDLTGAEIWVSPTSGESWTNVYSGPGVGGGSYLFPSGGTYYIVCNAYDAAGNKCSGNPWCSAWPPTAVPEVDCSGWVDCTASDLLTVTVAAPSCTINVPDLGISVSAGSTGAVVPAVTEANGSVDQVEFVVSDTSVATVCEFGTGPCVGGSYTDPAPGFRADLTGQSPSPPTTTLTVTGTMVDEGGVTCSDSTTVAVTNPGAWWQVHEGDAICGGNISSIIPGLAVNPYFITYDESPGIPMFSGTIDTGSGGVSFPIPPFGWQAEGALYSSTETRNYTYFFKRIPDTVTPADPGSSIGVNDLATTGVLGPSGYYWFSHTGDVTITNSGGETLGNNKVALFVDGDLTIEGDILLNDGFGFFAAIVSGDIVVDSGVGGAVGSGPHLEGLYIANSQFRTGTTGLDNDSQLHIRGSVVGLAGVVLERRMADNSEYPAEVFEYGIDQAFFFPPVLGTKRILWYEVAP